MKTSKIFERRLSGSCRGGEGRARPRRKNILVFARILQFHPLPNEHQSSFLCEGYPTAPPPERLFLLLDWHIFGISIPTSYSPFLHFYNNRQDHRSAVRFWNKNLPTRSFRLFFDIVHIDGMHFAGGFFTTFLIRDLVCRQVLGFFPGK